MNTVVLAMTGASGAIYGVRLLDILMSAGCQVRMTISPSAAQVLKEELGIHVDLENFDPSQLESAHHSGSGRKDSLPGSHGSSIFVDSDIVRGKLTYHHFQDFSAGIASGSFLTSGMVVCPCSMGTLAALASGISENLIHRAADVHLKERRKLIVVPRETPLSSIALQNMKTLADAGAVVLPAMPGFYHRPTNLSDLVDFVVSRICDQLGVRTDLMSRWGDRNRRTEPAFETRGTRT